MSASATNPWSTFALAVSVAAAPLGCSDDDDNSCGDEVITRIEPNTDFEAFQTFAIAENPDIDPPEDLPDDVEVHLGIANDLAAQELEEKGLTQVDPDDEDPDLWIFSVAATEENTGVQWVCVGGWVWWGWWGWIWDPCAWLTPVEVQYGTGTVIVGLADAEEEEVVFGGVIQGALFCGDPQERVEDGVREIFEDYPLEPVEPPGEDD